MRTSKLIGSILGVLLFIALMAGITYAWFTWRSSDVNISGTTGCFNLDYDKGQDIGSAESPQGFGPVCNYNESVSATVTVGVNSACDATGVGSINLNTTSFTLYDGTNAFDHSDIANIFKYQVVSVTTDGSGVETETEIEGCNGSIPNSSTISMCEVDVTSTPATYRVYVYLDCNYTTTAFIGATYAGYIQMVVAQNVE